MSKKGEGFIFILSNFMDFYRQMKSMGREDQELDTMIDACILELQKLKERHSVTAKKKPAKKKPARKKK